MMSLGDILRQTRASVKRWPLWMRNAARADAAKMMGAREEKMSVEERWTAALTTVRLEREAMLELSSTWDEHPTVNGELYNGPCNCRECRSYAVNDVG